MTDDTTNRHLKNWATTPKVVKDGLRAWSEHLARKRAAQAEADTAEAEPVEASEPELEPAEGEDEDEALFRLLRRRG